jgi:steroid delta-isomerase-like uncharacterized protein
MSRALTLCAALIAVAGWAFAATPQEENKAKTQMFYDEVANKGNVAVADQLLAEDFLDHQPFPGMKPGREGTKQFFSMMRAAFPDLKFDVKFMMAEGDKVAAFLAMSGTQKGEFMGMPASGKHFVVNTVDIVRIVDGKAVEHWGVTDGMSMMEQLGFMAPPGGK